MKRATALITVIAVTTTVAWITSASAATYDIKGAYGSAWTTAATWDPEIAGGPTSNDTIFVTGTSHTGAQALSLDISATIDSFTFEKNDNWLQWSASSAYTLTILNDLTVDTLNSLNFEGDNTYVTVNGNVSVNSGTLKFGASRMRTVTVGGTTTVASGTILQMWTGSSPSFGPTVVNGLFSFKRTGSGPSLYIAGLSGSGVLTNATTTAGIATIFYLSQTNGTFTFSGSICDDPTITTTMFNLQMFGAGGTQELSGINTYSGTTWARAGTLKISGTHVTGGAYFVSTTLMVEDGAIISTPTLDLMTQDTSFVGLNGGMLKIVDTDGLTFQRSGTTLDFSGGCLALEGTWDLAALTGIANSTFTVKGGALPLSELQFTAGTGEHSGYTLIQYVAPQAGTVISIR